MTDDFNTQLHIIATKIREKFDPQKIILFGSYAYGMPKKGSDIDILVIMDTVLKPYEQATLIRLFLDETLGVFYPIDIIVRTPDMIEKRLKKSDFFIKKILNEGVSYPRLIKRIGPNPEQYPETE